MSKISSYTWSWNSPRSDWRPPWPRGALGCFLSSWCCGFVLWNPLCFVLSGILALSHYWARSLNPATHGGLAFYCLSLKLFNKLEDPQAKFGSFAHLPSDKVDKIKLEANEMWRESKGPEDLYLNHGPLLTGCVILDKLLKLSEVWFCHLKWG